MKLIYVGERQCHLTKDLASQCNEMGLMLLLRSQTGVNESFFGPIWGKKSCAQITFMGLFFLYAGHCHEKMNLHIPLGRRTFVLLLNTS